MYNIDMCNIKSKNMLLKMKSIQIYCYPENSELSAFPFFLRYNEICKSLNFSGLKVHNTKYKHTDT